MRRWLETMPIKRREPDAHLKTPKPWPSGRGFFVSCGAGSPHPAAIRKPWHTSGIPLCPLHPKATPRRMKRAWIPLLLWSSSCVALAEGAKIAEGTPLAVAEQILSENGIPYGNQFGLQWLPTNGKDFLFCRLDKEATLILVYDTATKTVVNLHVHYPAPQVRSKADTVTVTPLSATFSPKEYSLTFKKASPEP